jgi:hypothetical protein
MRALTYPTTVGGLEVTVRGIKPRKKEARKESYIQDQLIGLKTENLGKMGGGLGLA